MGCDTRKPEFRVFDKVRFKSACSAIGTSYKIEISFVASLDMMLANKRITKALIRLCKGAGWSATLLFASPEDRFSHIDAHIQLKKNPVFPIEIWS